MTSAPLTTIRTFAELRVALAARKMALGLTNLEVDDIAGLQSGYTGKILCGDKRPGDMSLPSLLGALGVVLQLVPTASSHAGNADMSVASAERLKKIRQELASKGGKASRARISGEERRKSARHAARIRWRKWRELRVVKARQEKGRARRRRKAAKSGEFE